MTVVSLKNYFFFRVGQAPHEFHAGLELEILQLQPLRQSITHERLTMSYMERASAML